jgi:hypothetical protein
MRKIGIEAKLCREEHAKCRDCPIEKRLECQFAAEENYNQQMKYSTEGVARDNYESYRKFVGR